MLIDKFNSRKERPVSVVPLPVILVLSVALLAQISWHGWRPDIQATASDLPDTVSKITLQTMSMGEPVTLAKILMLWLQSFDNQPGLSIPFRDLDYDRVTAWLDLILALDERSQYPLLSASRLYAEVPDNERRRIMLGFVFRKFLEDPNTRWPWMAHAVYIAKHRLKDLDLAMEYARAIRLKVTSDDVPGWARQMELFILEDMGDIEGAKVLLGGLLESGVIKDRNELRFFEERLEKPVESEK